MIEQKLLQLQQEDLIDFSKRQPGQPFWTEEENLILLEKESLQENKKLQDKEDLKGQENLTLLDKENQHLQEKLENLNQKTALLNHQEDHLLIPLSINQLLSLLPLLSL